MKELEQVWFGEDGSLDIFVHESWGDLEAFREEVNSALVVRETDKGDFAVTPRDGLMVQGKGLAQ